MENLIGRYIKAKTDNYCGCGIEKGEIAKITGESAEQYFINSTGYVISKHIEALKENFDILYKEYTDNPEYVKCIQAENSYNKYILNKVYKLKEVCNTYISFYMGNGEGIGTVYSIDLTCNIPNRHLSTDFAIATEEDFLKSEGERTFEIGKWYKSDYPNGNPYYLKVKDFDFDKNPKGEAILENKRYSTSHWWNNTNTKKQALETGPIDVSEIQKWLPDEHIDKIVKDDYFIFPKNVIALKDSFAAGFGVNKGDIGELSSCNSVHAHYNFPNFPNYGVVKKHFEEKGVAGYHIAPEAGDVKYVAASDCTANVSPIHIIEIGAAVDSSEDKLKFLPKLKSDLIFLKSTSENSRILI